MAAHNLNLTKSTKLGILESIKLDQGHMDYLMREAFESIRE
jgi:hypothetical protein